MELAAVFRLALVDGVDRQPSVLRLDHEPVTLAHVVRHREPHAFESLDGIAAVTLCLPVGRQQAHILLVGFSARPFPFLNFLLGRA